MRTREADVHILITSVDAELPTVNIAESLANTEGFSTNLMLYSGSSAVISDSIIRITDPDSPKGESFRNVFRFDSAVIEQNKTGAKCLHPRAQ